MKQWILIGSLGVLLLGLSCYSNTPEDTNVYDNWNSVRSDWTDSNTYSENSTEAAQAVATYEAVAGVNTAANIAHFQIILQSVVENADGTQTWTYAISKMSDGRDFKDLSHFTMLFGNCDDTNIVNMAGGTYGPDPAASTCTGTIDGLKWDRGVSANETVLYSFTTDQVYSVGTVTGVVKYSTSCDSGTIPGPDCTPTVVDPGSSSSGSSSGGGDPTDPPVPPADNCPTWVDTLVLSASVTYKNYHGYNYLGFPVYYIGETMHSDLKICNNTANTATGLKVTTLVMKHPNGGLACGDPVHNWTGVTIAANDCLVLDHAFHLATNCVWGNYETHLVISKEAEGNCPAASLVVDTGAIGFFDP